MDKNFINQEKYERYVDATVDLVMDCYSDVLTENIHKEVDELESMEIEFPQHLHDQCITRIEAEKKKSKQRQRKKQVLRIFRMAAVFAVALLSLASILFVTVDAIRIPIINYFLEKYDAYWSITTIAQYQPQPAEPAIDWTDPLGGLLPETYERVLQEGDSYDNVAVIYENADSKEIFFSAAPCLSTIGIDSEGIDYSKEFLICGHDAILVSEDTYITLVLVNNSLDVIFTLVTDGLTETEVISIAKGFIAKIG